MRVDPRLELAQRARRVAGAEHLEALVEVERVVAGGDRRRRPSAWPRRCARRGRRRRLRGARVGEQVLDAHARRARRPARAPCSGGRCRAASARPRRCAARARARAGTRSTRARCRRRAAPSRPASSVLAHLAADLVAQRLGLALRGVVVGSASRRRAGGRRAVARSPAARASRASSRWRRDRVLARAVLAHDARRRRRRRRPSRGACAHAPASAASASARRASAGRRAHRHGRATGSDVTSLALETRRGRRRRRSCSGAASPAARRTRCRPA